MFFSVLIFFFKFVLLHLNPGVSLSSCIIHRFVGRIFSSVILKYPVLFVLLDPVLVLFACSFFRQYDLIYFFKLNSYTCLPFCFGLLIPISLRQFFLRENFRLMSQCFTYPSIQVLHSRSGSFRERRFYHRLVLLQHKSLMLPVGIFVKNMFTFSVSTETFYQSLFRGHDDVAYISVMIFFLNSSFIFFFCVDICFVV